MWKNYGMTFIEYIFLKKFRLNESHIEIKGKENINETVKNNKPVIFVSGHFANFELMAMEITKMNIKLAILDSNQFFYLTILELLFHESLGYIVQHFLLLYFQGST